MKWARLWIFGYVLLVFSFWGAVKVSAAIDLIATEVYFRDQPQNAGNRITNPQPGQQMYPHFSYTVNSTNALSGNLWQLELDGEVLCAFTGTEPTGPRIGWCTSPWVASSGSHLLRGVLDPGGTLSESNESNNIAALNFVLQGLPDIRINPLTLNFDSANNRTIYVEIDWMETTDHSHRPSADVLDRIVQTFAQEGFNLVVDLSNPLPHQDVIEVGSNPSASADVQAIRTRNFNHQGDSRYFYSIWGHNFSQNAVVTSSSGIADLPGQIHLITLGSFLNQVGTANNQIGTFIHELGHNLGQKHGGIDHENYKPNYLSVMNYLFQLDGIGPTVQSLGWANSSTGFNDFAYSHGSLSNLNENSLNEPAGLGLGRAIDWNCDGDTSDQGIARDLQTNYWCNANGPRSVLADFDNWSSITNYVLPGTNELRSVAPEQPSLPCITVQDYRSFRNELRLGEPVDLAMANATAGPRPTTAGEGLGFTIFNDGNSNLMITSITKEVPADWIAWTQATPFTVPPGGAQAIAVMVDFLKAPLGVNTRRLLVQSNDPDESPYPGGVNIVVNNRDCPPPQFTSLVRLFDGKMRLTLLGHAACNYRVEASTNLRNWLPLFSVPAGTNVNQLIDTNAPGFKVRFYRAVTQ
jgi:hypothetical protein